MLLMMVKTVFRALPSGKTFLTPLTSGGWITSGTILTGTDTTMMILTRSDVSLKKCQSLNMCG